MAAGKVETDLEGDWIAFLVKLLDLFRIDGHQVRADIAGVPLRVSYGRFYHKGHVTIDTGGDGHMVGDLSILEVTILALGAGGRFTCLAQLDNS